MFNDLLTKLDEKKHQVFAYADDLAVVNRGKYRLIEAITVIEK